ncbi:hypothetical protein PLEOSDRAFT_1088433 [Pleurotus ostreatus PC15]|uniref:Copper transport protein n=1 Tax=Pleurotus ostreatus (strain PC15) TaxID=1137138 RepID=A0A067P3V4_PLEO1|nr:hypothetical protein PLEOSDRAFT_1088433 [Pleurotus ostreatus PC15]
MSHGDMDMSGSSSSSSMSHGSGMMIPWLHFAGGDNLFFESWRPTSPGAIAGACIGLFILAIIDRWMAAVRRLMEAYWRRRALLVTAERTQAPLLAGDAKDDAFASVEAAPAPQELSSRSRHLRVRRTIAPFIAMHDLPRGALFAIQSLLMYTLMLAVMTFHAGYLIAIIVGLAIGEVLFGRLGDVHGFH